MFRRSLLKTAGLTVASAVVSSRMVVAQGRRPFAGKTLTMFSTSDRFGPGLQRIAPRFEQDTGIRLTVTLNGYPELYQRATADFVGKTGQGDLYSVDIVWTGEWAENGYIQDLSPLMEQNRAQLAMEDILPVMWKLGNWKGKQYAFPLAGYAGMLNYNRRAIPTAPKTLKELRATAERLTAGDTYGIAMNGARGAPVAQDWMYYMLANGGSILDRNGKPTINSARNVEALQFFRDLFRFAPPGAVTYAWGDREQAFNQGKALMQISWSTGLRDKLDPQKSKLADALGIAPVPVAEGVPVSYPFGGWGIGINTDSRNPEAAWEFIKWLAKPDIQREFVRLGSEPVRRSTLTDPQMVREFPYFPQILGSLERGNGDFRPRIPQYARIQDALGLAVNAVITGQKEPRAALDEVQKEIEPLFAA